MEEKKLASHIDVNVGMEVKGEATINETITRDMV